MQKLAKLRADIDHIDRGIFELIRARVDLAKEIGKVKRKYGKQVEDKEREEKILKSKGEFRDIFKQIIKYCKNEERK